MSATPRIGAREQARRCAGRCAFLRYLHHQGLNARPLADCVPSMRRWKLATLPTFLAAAQVRRALDGCDRKTVMGRRDYAILLLLAKLGLRADEVATLTLDDIDWRSMIEASIPLSPPGLCAAFPKPPTRSPKCAACSGRAASSCSRSTAWRRTERAAVAGLADAGMEMYRRRLSPQSTNPNHDRKRRIPD